MSDPTPTPDTAAPVSGHDEIHDAVRAECRANGFPQPHEIPFAVGLYNATVRIAGRLLDEARASRSVAGTPTPAGTSAAADEFERFAGAMREVLQQNPEYTHGSLAWRLMNALDSRAVELRTDARYLRPQVAGTAALTEDLPTRDQVWDVIATVRDAAPAPREPDDADTDDIIDALVDRGILRLRGGDGGE